jgi:hypothetical protein
MPRKKFQTTKKKNDELKIELLRIVESDKEFQLRKEEVQTLLVHMSLRASRRGRPPKDEEEVSNVA